MMPGGRVALNTLFRRNKNLYKWKRTTTKKVFRRKYSIIPDLMPPFQNDDEPPLGYKTVIQSVTLRKGGKVRFKRKVLVKERAKISELVSLYDLAVGGMLSQDPSTMSEEDREEYKLTRRTWLDLIENAPGGSIAQALDMIGGRLYEWVGELGGRGIGKTFDDNKELFYSQVTIDNVCQWAKYETGQIGNATYTTSSTKLAGQFISEAGRAWLIWLCHCARTGSTGVDEKVLAMNARHPWSKLTSIERTAIGWVAALNPDVAAIVPTYKSVQNNNE